MKTLQAISEDDLYAEQSLLRVREIEAYILHIQRQTHTFNLQAPNFKVQVIDIEASDTILNSIRPFTELWDVIVKIEKNITKWLDTCIKDLDPNVPMIVEEGNKVLNHLLNYFRNNNAVVQVRLIAKYHSRLNEIRVCIPLLNILRSSALRHRHWKEITDLLRLDEAVKLNECSLQQLKNHGALDYLETILFISNRAMKESFIEKSISYMEAYWAGTAECIRLNNSAGVKIMLEPAVGSKSFTVSNMKEILDELEDQLAKCYSLSNNIFSVPFADAIEEWGTKVRRAQDGEFKYS